MKRERGWRETVGIGEVGSNEQGKGINLWIMKGNEEELREGENLGMTGPRQ
jgi:hypothetical protein